jgi:hypothetical protein
MGLIFLDLLLQYHPEKSTRFGIIAGTDNANQRKLQRAAPFINNE